MKNLITKIRSNEIDINNQQSYLGALIKAVMNILNKSISVRDTLIPHIILSTGDDRLYLEQKAIDYTIDPTIQSNENYIYNIIPRCIVTPGGVTFLPDQLTSPYSLGNIQFEYEDMILNLTGEFRRLPLKIEFELTYYFDTYTDTLELIQQVATKLAFIKTFKFVYMGQVISASYSIPESMNGEYSVELDGASEDNRHRKVTMSLEVESNLPVFNPQTIMDSTSYITKNGGGFMIYNKDTLNKEQSNEIVEWNSEAGKGY
ncbi:MAG: hypothetical protein IKU29_07105 [Parabacteroides sp.]|nr:hypothetical protein [Parabacteroides sp.]